jgi:hypothetical protein
MHPDPAPDPDPTPFFGYFKDATKNFFSYFFLITYPQAHYLQSFNEKKEGSLMDPNPDGPKICGSGSVPTLASRVAYFSCMGQVTLTLTMIQSMG